MKYYSSNDEEHLQNMLDATAIDFSHDPGMTRQEPAEDADINVLMKRMGLDDGGRLPYFNNPDAMWGVDLSSIENDPVLIHNAMLHAQEIFMTIAADVRQKFTGPADMYQYLADPANREEATKLGLLKFNDTTSAVSSSTGSVKEPPVPTTNSDGE